MDTFTLHCIANELNNKILNVRINKIYQFEKEIFAIHLSNKNKLIISLKKDFPTIFLFNEKIIYPETPDAFCMLLRKYLNNGIIYKIESIKFYRIMEVFIRKGDNKFILKLNFSGKNNNLFLTDNSEKIIANLNKFIEIKTENIEKLSFENFEIAIRNNNFSGFPPYIIKELLKIYKEKGELEAYNFYNHLYNFSFICKPTICENKVYPFPMTILKDYEIYSNFSSAYSKFFKTYNFEYQKNIAIKKIKKNIKKLLKTLKKIEEELEKKKNFEIFFKYGELLKANIYQLKKGMSSITVQDFYNENLSTIEIPLDIKKSPAENIEYYFKLGKKAKRGVNKLKERINEIKTELNHLEESLFFIEQYGDIEVIQEYIKEKTNKSKNLPKVSPKFSMFDFKGKKIVMGKSGKSNDYILKNFGKPEFLWLHTKDYPGAHIIILEKESKVDNELLLYAAKLAFKNSKAKTNAKGEVIYTPIKYVKKIKGAPPGAVVLEKFKTLMVSL